MFVSPVNHSCILILICFKGHLLLLSASNVCPYSQEWRRQQNADVLHCESFVLSLKTLMPLWLPLRLSNRTLHFAEQRISFLQKQLKLYCSQTDINANSILKFIVKCTVKTFFQCKEILPLLVRIYVNVTKLITDCEK